MPRGDSKDRRLRASVLAVLVGALTGCPATPPGGTPKAAPAADAAAVTRLAAALGTSCGGATTDAVIEALARAGIETRDDVTNDLVQEVLPPKLGMRVTRMEARGMGCELANRGGLLGAHLNAVAGPLPLPGGASLPFSSLLGAFVTVPPARFGSQLAHALMPGVKVEAHASLRYPTLVVALFAREVVVPMLAQLPGGPGKRDRVQQAVDTDPCAAISKALDDLPEAARNAVGSLDDGEGGWWSTVVAGASAVAGVVAFATATAARTALQHLPFANALKTAVTAGAAVADLKAMFTQWTLTVEAQPPKVHKSVGAVQRGDLVLTVKPPEDGFEWPQPVKSCAELLGVSLPDFNSADETGVYWTPGAGFQSPATEESMEETVVGGKATFTFTTVEEDEAVHLAGGPEQSTPAVVAVDLGLPGLQHLAQTLAGLMSAPGVGSVARVGGAVAAAMLGPSTSGKATITFHGSPATLDIRIVDDATFELHAVSCAGVGGPYTGTAKVIGTTGGEAPLTPFSFDPMTNMAQLALTIPMSGECTGTYGVSGPLTLAGTSGAPVVNVAAQVAGSLQCPEIGGVPLSAPATGSFPLVIGPAPECP